MAARYWNTKLREPAIPQRSFSLDFFMAQRSFPNLSNSSRHHLHLHKHCGCCKRLLRWVRNCQTWCVIRLSFKSPTRQRGPNPIYWDDITNLFFTYHCNNTFKNLCFFPLFLQVLGRRWFLKQIMQWTKKVVAVTLSPAPSSAFTLLACCSPSLHYKLACKHYRCMPCLAVSSHQYRYICILKGVYLIT